jgi:hypothetical protein
MEAKAEEARPETSARRSASPDRAAQNGNQDGNEQARRDHAGPGIDLPVVGHVEYKSAGFLVGLGVAGAVGVIEWPVAAAVGIGYALARRA